MNNLDLTPAERDDFRDMLEAGAHRLTHRRRVRAQLIAGACAVVLVVALSGGVIAGGAVLGNRAFVATTPTASPTPSGTSSPTAVTQRPTLTPTPSSTPSQTASVEPEDGVHYPTADTISCETMLTEDADRALRTEGWVPKAKGWTNTAFIPIGAKLECPWGPEDSLAGEAMAYYVWAKLAPGEASDVIAAFEANGDVAIETDAGWRFEHRGYQKDPLESGVLLTEEWFAMAPTQEQISDIVWTH